MDPTTINGLQDDMIIELHGAEVIAFAEKLGMVLSNEEKRLILESGKTVRNNESSVRKAISQPIRDAYVKKNRHFFEEYLAGEKYNEKLRPFYVKLKDGKVEEIQFTNATNQKVILTSMSMTAISDQNRFKIAMQSEWREATFVPNTVSDDMYEVLSCKTIDIKLRYDTDDLAKIVNRLGLE